MLGLRKQPKHALEYAERLWTTYKTLAKMLKARGIEPRTVEEVYELNLEELKNTPQDVWRKKIDVSNFPPALRDVLQEEPSSLEEYFKHRTGFSPSKDERVLTLALIRGGLEPTSAELKLEGKIKDPRLRKALAWALPVQPIPKDLSVKELAERLIAAREAIHLLAVYLAAKDVKLPKKMEPFGKLVEVYRKELEKEGIKEMYAKAADNLFDSLKLVPKVLKAFEER